MGQIAPPLEHLNIVQNVKVGSEHGRAHKDFLDCHLEYIPEQHSYIQAAVATNLLYLCGKQKHTTASTLIRNSRAVYCM